VAARRPGTAGTPVEAPVDELTRALGSSRGPKSAAKVKEAARAFEREQYLEARRILKPIAEDAPGSPSVRELYGLTLYRLGRWKEAARELEAFRSLTASVEQHPVLADAHRALKHFAVVDELWDELRAASPSAELVTEGRIVVAGALADRGELSKAIRLLEDGRKRPPKRPGDHHLRLAYVLADLYERSGDLPRSRDLFGWIVASAPGFADAAERRAALH
jgi:predicted Zn-dependent protease